MTRAVLAVTMVLALIASAAVAQTNSTTPSVTTGGGTTQAAPVSTASMAELVKAGYEIKAAVPNGQRFIIFMQKDQAAYACEFVSLTNTRCGLVN